MDRCLNFSATARSTREISSISARRPASREPLLLSGETNLASSAGAELVSPERSSGSLDAGRRAEIEDISRVERAVAEKFKHRSMQLIRSRLRHGYDLRAGAFPI